jgi:glucose-6-phosphate dehydrogenase assembly protein OpcA
VEETLMPTSTTTIKPEKILKELADLWIETAAPSDANAPGESSGVLRACSMTMLVIADESDDPHGIGETLAHLMKEHPSRAIVIRLRKSGEPWLESRVFAQCWKPFGMRQHICCEQIEIVSSEASLPDVPAVVLPLIVADLPVILWCRSGRVTELDGFRELEALAQKVIFDSASFADSDRALGKLLSVALPGTRVADLAWGRLTRSRELIAQTVNSDDLLESLRRVDEVRIHARGPKPTVPALYFAAWLSNRLALTGSLPKLEWDLEEWSEPLSLKGVTLKAPDGFTLSVEVKETVPHGAVVDLKVDGRVNRVVLLRPSEYELLLQELSIPGRDPIYEAALRRAATVM